MRGKIQNILRRPAGGGEAASEEGSRGEGATRGPGGGGRARPRASTRRRMLLRGFLRYLLRRKKMEMVFG